jgi:outer membrane lipoprotein-sorting protein
LGLEGLGAAIKGIFQTIQPANTSNNTRKSMHPKRTCLFILFIALLLAARVSLAAAPDDKDRILRQLDAAAAKFRSTTADFQFDTYMTDPIPDQETQTGMVYYERDGKNFRMAAHISQDNKKKVEKVYTFSGGVFKLFEGGDANQVTTFSQASKFESYLMLGFGASGRELEEKWEIKYLGPETLLDGKNKVKTEKLELIAKDPAVRKNLPKVTIWVDPVTGVNLKQVFDEGQGQTRVSVYFNIKINQPLPADAFTFKTDKQTTFVNR